MDTKTNTPAHLLHTRWSSERISVGLDQHIHNGSADQSVYRQNATRCILTLFAIALCVCPCVRLQIFRKLKHVAFRRLARNMQFSCITPD